MCEFYVKGVHSTNYIWKHKHDFRLKLQDTKFNNYLKSLKSQNSVAQQKFFLISLQFDWFL